MTDSHPDLNQTTSALPKWNLTDLYSSLDDPKIKSDFESILKDAHQFQADYKDKLSGLNAANFLNAFIRYDDLSSRLYIFSVYPHLMKTTHQNDDKVGAFYGDCEEKTTAVNNYLIFFVLELNSLAEAHIEKFFTQEKDLKEYKYFLQELKKYKAHQLDENLEKLNMDKNITGRNSFLRLYDETFSRLRFEYEGKMVTIAEILHNISNIDREKRKIAALSFEKVMAENTHIYTFIINNILKDKAIEDKHRNFAEPIDSRNLDNSVEKEVVEAMLDAVRESYASTSHRYYRLKAKILGLEKLEYYDRNAPLPFSNDKKFSWPEAQEVVVDAYRSFSPRLASIVKEFFDKQWIDAAPESDKESGAYCVGIHGKHPYMLMNYQGKARDIFTLAHELGHGAHFYLANEKQKFLNFFMPLTIAETASVFGEQLTFRSMLKKETDPKVRAAILAGKIDDSINTIIRQATFARFEMRLHNLRKEKELTTEEIGKIWIETQSECLGDGVIINENQANYWMYISHFIHVPFYVYAYSFGNLLVDALYQSYINNDVTDFEEKYITFLASGGSQSYKELLKPFNFDLTDPNFWKLGLNMLSSLIDELEDNLKQTDNLVFEG